MAAFSFGIRGAGFGRSIVASSILLAATWLVDSRVTVAADAAPSGASTNLPNAASNDQTDSDGFTSLFNGRDLSGWTPVNVAPNTFTARDGMIVSTGKPTGVLRTSRHYENFDLELDWKHLVAGGNAGLFVYSEPVTALGVPFTKSIEVQIIDGDSPDGVWTGHGDLFSIHGARMKPDRPHPLGWERCLPSERRAKPAGEWNHYRVESRDGRLTLAVNGKVVSGASECRPRRGYICLESEGTECHFRNLKIRELPSSSPPADATASLEQRFQSLYTGLNLDGWQATPEHAEHWRANDWILSCDGAGPADLQSETGFQDFEMICDWKSPAGAKAGVVLSGPDERVVPLSPTDGKWRRATLTARAGKLTVRYSGDTQPVEQSLDRRSVGPVALRHYGQPIEFANLYVRRFDDAQN